MKSLLGSPLQKSLSLCSAWLGAGSKKSHEFEASANVRYMSVNVYDTGYDSLKSVEERAQISRALPFAVVFILYGCTATY